MVRGIQRRKGREADDGVPSRSRLICMCLAGIIGFPAPRSCLVNYVVLSTLHYVTILHDHDLCTFDSLNDHGSLVSKLHILLEGISCFEPRALNGWRSDCTYIWCLNPLLSQSAVITFYNDMDCSIACSHCKTCVEFYHRPILTLSLLMSPASQPPVPLEWDGASVRSDGRGLPDRLENSART